ncbi:MAG: hypothetical protein KA154_15785 [Gemmatimonadaceae bacterium]|jgi:hypothetical protein|nr:hypothetical protein [Gemmatimonadaceae bacterium]
MNISHLSLVASAVAVLGAGAAFGPPHITVRAGSAADVARGSAFELTVEHHTSPDQLSVTGRAEGVRAGRRVALPLTITRQSDSRFTVARQWDSTSAWVLVFSAEQGPHGSHGVVDAVVSINVGGAVQRIEYTPAVIRAKSGDALPKTAEKVDAALRSLGLVVSTR